MIHPDLKRVMHLSEVKQAIRDYRQAYKDAAASKGQHADDFRGVKTAENRINELVETIIAGF